jgi:hypothetical protein
MIDPANITDVDAPEALELVLELARVQRRSWPAMLAELRASGTPLNADDDDDDDGAAADGGATDDDDDEAAGGKPAGSDDDDADELTKARKAVAAANRELKALKAEKAREAESAKKNAGKFEELYNDTQAELDKLKAKVETDAKTRLAESALAKAKAKNPAKVVKLLDLDDLDDDNDAERAVKRLKKEMPELFDDAPTRQKRGGGGSNDDDEGDRPKRPVNRLRRGLEAAAN